MDVLHKTSDDEFEESPFRRRHSLPRRPFQSRARKKAVQLNANLCPLPSRKSMRRLRFLDCYLAAQSVVKDIMEAVLTKTTGNYRMEDEELDTREEGESFSILRKD